MATDERAARREWARLTAAPVEGWLTDAEGACLFDLAASCDGTGVIVEIGSWKGKSTVWIAAGATSGAQPPIYAIDPHEGSFENPEEHTLAAFRATLARAALTSAVTPILARSDAAAPSFQHPIQFLFLDGDHELAMAARDLHDWLPKIVPGGSFAMHDVVTEMWPGPRRALKSVLWRTHELARVRFVDSIAWGQRVRANTLADRLRNRAIAVLLHVYDVMPRRLPAPLAGPIRSLYRLTPLKRHR